MNWLRQETPIPNWALLSFFFLVLHGIVEVIGWLT